MPHMTPRRAPRALARVVVLSLGIVGWYGYRVSGFQVDLWTALMLCSSS